MEIIEIVIAVGVSMVTFFIGYGVLLQKVNTLQKEVKDLQADGRESSKMFNQIIVTLAKFETKVETDLHYIKEKINSKE